jgi:hypothetical protein
VLRRRQAAAAPAAAGQPPAPAAPAPSPAPTPTPPPPAAPAPPAFSGAFSTPGGSRGWEPSTGRGYAAPAGEPQVLPTPRAVPAPDREPAATPTSTSGGSRARHARDDVPHDTPLPGTQPPPGASEAGARTCLRCGRVASAGEMFCSYCHQPLRRRSDA